MLANIGWMKISCPHLYIVFELINTKLQPEFVSIAFFFLKRVMSPVWKKEKFKSPGDKIKAFFVVLYVQITKQCNSQRIYFAFWQVLIRLEGFIIHNRFEDCDYSDNDENWRTAWQPSKLDVIWGLILFCY